jgi:hypothetical protein
VQSSRCAHCGAALAPGTQFCAYCGAPTGAAAPPVGGVPPAWSPSPGPLPGGYGVPPPPRRRSHLLIIVVVIVVLVLIFAVVAYEFEVANSPQVNISEINVWASDNVCGLMTSPNGTYPLQYTGYATNTSENDSWEFYDIPNVNSTACTIEHVATNTSGFQVWAEVPAIIPAEDPNGTLNLSIIAPGSSFNGVLNLIFG